MDSRLACDSDLPMSPTLHHECTRVPVTALAACGALLIAAEGPFLRFYLAKDSRYLSSVRIFKAQAIHGICVLAQDQAHVSRLVIWGGKLVRSLDVDLAGEHGQEGLNLCVSNIARASDWILDLAPRPKRLEDDRQYTTGTCVAVTAHNALLQVTVESQNPDTTPQENAIHVTISDLTSSSRSILYSAHLFWEGLNRVLVAAGTAFGEIIYWSWSDEDPDEPASRICRVFLGHEGSIFGVQISEELPTECCQKLKRVVASCSDDRTIRIWDVSDVNTNSTKPESGRDDLEALRTRHTGFSNEAFDSEEFNSSNCLAIGWGHLSRVWTVRFLEASPCNGSLLLQSAGEDATARTWELTQKSKDNQSFPYQLQELDCSAHHSGKNMWSSTISNNSTGVHQVIAGGADSKITATPLGRALQVQKNTGNTISEYTVHDILSWTQSVATGLAKDKTFDNHKSSKKAEFFRSYCFIDETTFLVTTNSGKVLVGALFSGVDSTQSSLLSTSTSLGQLDDLSGYSVCTSGPQAGVAFAAGANGSIYMYRKSATTLTKIHTVGGKVGQIFAANVSDTTDQQTTALLVTLVGQGEAQMLYLDPTCDTNVLRVVSVPISDSSTGIAITSMAHVGAAGQNFAILGFRRGSIAVYEICDSEEGTGQATLTNVVENAHNGETVTSITWVASPNKSTEGQLFSVGRDGRLTVHHIDLSTSSVELVHDLSLPFGPNIEGLYFQDNRLLVHGFSSKRWYLYDITAEEEIMSIDTGGAHRRWTFRAHSSLGGTLVWTRASSMHISNQKGSNHTVIRSGGHGREMKAIAVSPKSNHGSEIPLIATGAEDTDIKIFQYVDGELTCRRTLRRHTTGIQHLQWSENGEYLCSSGGCEEFYIWRIRKSLSSPLDIGVVCEHVYMPESEHADLRIMSFDVVLNGSALVIAMVFSDSSIKVYRYDAAAAVKWQPLFKGLYFTSCLSQCIFLSATRILTAGTDGHAVIWHLPPATDSTVELTWQHPARIHQNSSKAMISHSVSPDTTLIVSGGDDGSLAFILARPAPAHAPTSPAASYASPPTLLNRAHASAVTACAIVTNRSRIYLITSGNDEWIRLWEIALQEAGSELTPESAEESKDALQIRRLRKIKTNVADVSSMAVLDESNDMAHARVLVCGVGMEVIRADWATEGLAE
ncbi:WD40 repeat [Pyrenophora tritici-repentis]|nr:WD40 repeat protein [Pyrenophora tritici-repentis]KAI0586124.1 WD40 repeat-like protein [Pyrenophora tritici-repentis]KAI0615035.1 WD40 repeat-like protein [Pyrenophora tritici-repentis]KAI1558790.1 WD40 repeat [Pyrenophora tritici-repentis]PZD46764.1 WD40 repeat protein [Pyrenophora tritici-repentis]